ncbi:MAG: hypothetical protein NTV79_00020, partial [Candidatus Aureabacteria bacterium]|nr:hypothetical protein [Candidatus Auribacterota bacterium]
WGWIRQRFSTMPLPESRFPSASAVGRVRGGRNGSDHRNGMKRYLAEAKMGGRSTITLITPGGSNKFSSCGMGHSPQVQ